MHRPLFPLAVAVVLAAAPLAAFGQLGAAPPPAPPKTEPPKTEPPKTDPAKPGDKKAEPPKTDDKKPEEKKPEDKRTPEQKKYDEILKTAKVQEGVFRVLKTEEKIYWAIPESKLGRLYFWQTEIAQMPKELGYPGTDAGNRTIRWVRREKKLQMRNATFSTRAVGTDEGTRAGVEANTIEPILWTFDIAGEGPNKEMLIDVTSLFTSDPQDFSIREQVPGFAGVDPSKTYIERVKAFPTNIETRTTMTVRIGAPGGRMNPFVMQSPYGASTATLVVHYSVAELPEKPMMGRLKDSRIGYFTTGFTEFGRSDDSRATPVEYINRFRLEKKDPNAPLSEPVKPITFYLAREVPVKWRPYVKQAIEDWQVAFEQAGFKNAIVAKDAPTLKEDPEWDAEDARYSVIRWAPSETENAMGPSVQDPRSGETLSAHIIVWNDIVRLAQTWYFSQAAAIDPAARRLPLPDPLTGKLVRYVVAHEVGHTLGLEHNFRGSVAYSTKQLRDPAFTKANGVAASIMSYSRFNYLAQPGDGVTETIGKVGPYDKFAIEYGYKPPMATDAEGEKPQLDLLLSKQLRDPALRFGNYRYIGIDPTTQMELIGEDQVEATRLGLKNLNLIARDYLLSGTTRFGEDYTRLEEARSALIGQYLTEVGRLIAEVGGVRENDTHSGRGDGPVFTPVPAERQRAAVRLLLSEGIKMPPALNDPKVLAKVAPTGTYDANPFASSAFNQLFSEARLRRMQDAEAAYGKGTYTVAELTNDAFQGVFKEVYAGVLAKGPTTIGINERALQRGFLKTVDSRVNGSSPSKTDFRPLAKAKLKEVARQIDAFLPRTKDPVTAAHLVETRSDIEKIIADRYAKPGAPAPISLLDLLLGGAKGSGAKGEGERWKLPTTATPE